MNEFKTLLSKSTNNIEYFRHIHMCIRFHTLLYQVVIAIPVVVEFFEN